MRARSHAQGDDTLPAIDHGVLRSMALQPGRDVTRSARLLSLQ